MTISAIETHYAGCRFRSRLEARWAVFFDALEINWEYEPEGYRTPAGPYLPDFLLHLPGGDAWFEVKPENDETSDPRWTHVAESTGCNLFVARGMPRPADLTSGYGGDHIRWEAPGWDVDYAFCYCPICDRIGIQFEGRGIRVCASSHGNPSGREHTGDDPRIIHAYTAARSARFEHGETP